MCYMYMHIVSDMEIYALVLLNIDLLARNEVEKELENCAGVGGKRKSLAHLRLLFGNLILRSQQKHHHQQQQQRQWQQQQQQQPHFLAALKKHTV